ncbi:MAG: HupE/UreJ family protein [Bacteroidia bacterium]
MKRFFSLMRRLANCQLPIANCLPIVIGMPLTQKHRIALCLLPLALLLSDAALAHTINYQLEQQPSHYVFWYYLKLGYQHIMPYGFDHILFVVGLCLLSEKIKTIIWQATAFTIAHSVTLTLAMKGIIAPQSSIIEPIIALSIVFVAIENLIVSELKPWRIAVVFMFGLIHGCGFASSLNELGLPRNAFGLSLFSFNVGVELGQITIILSVYFLLTKWFASRTWYRPRIVYPISICIAMIALYWTVQRVFLV